LGPLAKYQKGKRNLQNRSMNVLRFF